MEGKRKGRDVGWEGGGEIEMGRESRMGRDGREKEVAEGVLNG